MQKRLITLLFLASTMIIGGLQAQTPAEIKYKTWDMHALRYYPFKTKADSIIAQTLALIPHESPHPAETTYSFIDLAANKDFLSGQLAYSKMKNNFFHKLILNPYRHWFEQMQAIKEDKPDLKVNLLSSNEAETGTYSGIFFFPGNYTTTKAIADMLGDMDIYEKYNDVGLEVLSGPLHPQALKQYQYFLSAETTVDSIPCYEIAFFSQEKKDRTTEGLIFIDKTTFLPVKAILTANFSLPQKSAKNMLITVSFIDGLISHKETQLFLGDEMSASILISQQQYYDKEAPSAPPASSLIPVAQSTPAWRNTLNTASFLLTGCLPLGKNPILETGPLLQTVSHNRIEGFRFRLGLNTTPRLNNRFAAQAYAAYGTKDEQFKYGATLHYSFKPVHDSFNQFPMSLLSVSYVSDLNVPGQDILTSTRDNIFTSLYHSAIKSMSWQKLALISYKHELSNGLSFQLSGRRLAEKPMGEVRYEPFVTSELGLKLRYAPHEKTIRLHNRDIYLRSANIEINLAHKAGFKGLFNADYDYHITTLSLAKQFFLPANIGRIYVDVEGGKVWNSLPFRLLFTPRGNQSYLFNEEDYNLMGYHEFVTDRFVASKLNLNLNYSPLSPFFPKLGIQTNIGAKVLYGPLSDKNNPDEHPSLTPFNGGVQPLGQAPYIEASIGFSNILKIFRIDYVRRLSYLDDPSTRKGSLFFGAGLAF